MKLRANIVFAVLAAATLAFGAAGLSHVVRASRHAPSSSSAGHADLQPETAIRRLLSEHGLDGGRIFLVTSGDKREASVERSLRQAAAWVAMPTPVRHGPVADIGDVDAALSPLFDDAANSSIATTGRFREAGAAAGRRLWIANARPDAKDGAETTAASPARELAGLAPLAAVCLAGGLAAGAAGALASALVFSLLLFLALLPGMSAGPMSVWFLAALSATVPWAFLRRRPGAQVQGLAWPVTAGAAVFAATAAVALSHRLVTPYGLAVTGGKARLWLLAGGVPQGFFADDAAWGLLEPAYPPGCASLALGCYAAAGACGDWLTQLAPCLFAAASAAFLASRTTGMAGRVWLLSLFLTPLALMTPAQFYPEPILALGVLAGWERIRGGRASGWLILGATGWFKNEGLLLLPAAWIAWRVSRGAARARLRDLAAALALPAAWHIGCRMAGASLHDYAAPWRLSPMRGVRAILAALRVAFARPWVHGFAYPAALVAAVREWRRRELGKDGHASMPPLHAALLFAALSFVFFGLAYACSTADEAWHLSTSLERLLLSPALVLARECVADGGRTR